MRHDSAARILHFGTPKHLQIDDYLMLLALVVYTVELVSINIAATTSTNLLPPGYLETHTLSTTEIQDRTYGSKMTLVTEQCQCGTVWLVKACLLIMYYRITNDAFAFQNLAVKILSAYTAITFVVMEIFYFAVWCVPFHNYWAVPTPDSQCSAAIHHLIMNAVFNLSSDLAMLCIALPMFLRSHLPLQRKLTLSAIFGLGVFVILCAVLNKYYSFTDPFGILWVYWYVRECSTALLVANLPFLWGLIRRFLGLRDGDDARSALNSHAWHGVLPMLRRKISVVPGLQVSRATGTGTAITSTARKNKSTDDTSGHSGSPMLNHGEHVDSFAMQSLVSRNPSPSKLEAGRPRSRASSRTSSKRPSSIQIPASRLEAEIMMDDNVPSPRLPFTQRNSEGVTMAQGPLQVREEASTILMR